jgi:hypothetical protein
MTGSAKQSSFHGPYTVIPGRAHHRANPESFQFCEIPDQRCALSGMTCLSIA